MRLVSSALLCWLLFCLTAQAQSDRQDSASPDSADATQTGPLAGHSYHGEAFNEGPRQRAYLMEGLGQANFPITTDVEQAQSYFNQGVDQLHGFWYFEAERSFRQVAMLDPGCPMAYWGLAMANINNESRARKFIKEARLKAGILKTKEDGESSEDAEASPVREVSEREKRYIDGLAAYYSDQVKDKKKRAQNYTDAMEKLVLEFPDDIEAKAFLVCQLWMNQRQGLPISSHVAVNSILDQIFAAEPMHPAHHYRIHLWDYKNPDQALHSAAMGGPSLPGIAHMWHMPGHIYSRLKRYNDAAWQQEASARVDHAHMMRDWVLPDQIHNFAHNNEWLVRNLNHVGRVDDAIALAQNMISLPQHPKYNTLTKRGSAYYGRQRLLETLNRFERWQDLIDLCDTSLLPATDDPLEQLKRLRHLGRAHYRIGNDQSGAVVLQDLQKRLTDLKEQKQVAVDKAVSKAKQSISDQQAAAERLALWLGDDFRRGLFNQLRRKNRKTIRDARQNASKKLDGQIGAVNKAIAEMEGYQLLASGDFKQALAKFNKAGEVDRVYCAWVQHKAGQTDKALQAARKYVDSRTNEVQPLAMLAWLQFEAGQSDDARKTFQTLQEISGSIDLHSPVFTRLSAIADELGLPEDWRTELVPPDDLGTRPDIQSLGPFRWQPVVAPDWQLTDSHGDPVSLKHYSGQPVVVIFYLGYECLHCAEQLQTFIPKVAEFQEAGIEMIAISSDDHDGLKQSIENYGQSPFPITMMADPQREVFQLYRAYDEFEDQPLHATYLIDAAGFIRWHDISYEPFMDAEFLLTESKRLLAHEVVDRHVETATHAEKDK